MTNQDLESLSCPTSGHREPESANSRSKSCSNTDCRSFEPNVTNASLDRLLATLVLAMAATGLLTLWAGSPAAGWLFTVHDLLAGALAVAIGIRLRRSLPQAAGGSRWGRLAVARAVSFMAV